MIFFGFVIRNPFSQKHDLVYEKSVKITKNTSAEMCMYRTNSIIGLGFYITGFKQDHRGFGVDLDLFGYNVDFNFYDNRHAADY